MTTLALIGAIVVGVLTGVMVAFVVDSFFPAPSRHERDRRFTLIVSLVAGFVAAGLLWAVTVLP